MTREEAIERFNGIINAMSISIAQSKFYPSKAELNELGDMAIEALQTEVVRCKDCRWYDNRYGDVCHNPRYGDGWANYPPPYVDEDYWCKDGERKGGDDE